MTRPALLVLATLLLSLHPDLGRAQAPAPPAPPATPAPAASAPAPATAASAPNVIPRVEISATADTDETLRRRQNIAMSVYGREELDRQGDIDVTDVLKRLPGVSMEAGAPRLRGLGGGYTQILINGEPAPPGFTLDTVAPGDVERIEVVKGATAEYPGVAGTINVVLREPPKTRNREWRSNLNYRAVQPGASTALQWGDRIGGISFVVPVNVTRSAQGTSYDTTRISRTPAGEVQSQAITGRDEGRAGSGQIAPRLQWKFSEFDTLNLGAFAQKGESRSRSARDIATLLGTPWATARDGSETEAESEVRRLNGSWARRTQDGGKIEIKGSWQDTERESDSFYTGLRRDASVITQRETRSFFDETRAAAGARWSQSVSDEHTLLIGWDGSLQDREELRRIWDFGVERIDSATGIPFAARMERHAVFAQDQWAINDQWALQPGLRVEQLRTKSADARYPASAIDNLARVTTPVLHLNYKFDPKGKDQIRAGLTRSFKMPDLSALVARYVLNGNYERDETNTPIAADRAGNPNLQPELSTGLDLHFEHYPAAGGVFSIGVFHRRISGLIRQRIALENGTAPDITSMPRWVSRPVNLGDAVSRGLELEVKGRAEDWLPWFFSAESGVQIRGAWNFYRSRVEQVDGPDNRLEAQPPWLANMGFDWRVKNSGWTLGASLVLTPGYTTRQTDLQLARRSAVRNFDAFASWRVDRMSSLRIGWVNLLARDSETANSVEDLDGFSAGSSTRRNTLRTVNASYVLRF